MKKRVVYGIYKQLMFEIVRSDLVPREIWRLSNKKQQTCMEFLVERMKESIKHQVWKSNEFLDA